MQKNFNPAMPIPEKPLADRAIAALKRANLEILRETLDKGVDPNFKVFDYFISPPLLTYACSQKDPDFLPIVELLLEFKADINIKDNFGSPPVFYAAFFDDPSFPLLMQRGCDMSIKNKQGFRVLDLLITGVNPEKVNLLADHFTIDEMTSSIENLQKIAPLEAEKINVSHRIAILRACLENKKLSQETKNEIKFKSYKI